MSKIEFKSAQEKSVIIQSIIILCLSVIIDHVTKYLIVKDTSLLHAPIKVIPGFFNIVSVRNTGAAFGMFHNNNIPLLSVAAIAFVLLIVFYKSMTEGWRERYYALALILSGIIGNCLDRIIRHSVVDFLDFQFGSYHWPSFNIADSAICIGVALLIISFIVRPTDKKEK